MFSVLLAGVHTFLLPTDVYTSSMCTHAISLLTSSLFRVYISRTHHLEATLFSRELNVTRTRTRESQVDAQALYLFLGDFFLPLVLLFLWNTSSKLSVYQFLFQKRQKFEDHDFINSFSKEGNLEYKSRKFNLAENRKNFYKNCRIKSWWNS